MAKKAATPARLHVDGVADAPGTNGATAGALAADIIIKNAPDPVFVSDLEGKILQANDAVSQLLGFRQDEVVEQSLSRSSAPRRRASSPPRSARSSSGA
jgi:PAS domain-containing protein